jgi:catechol 2,3-dioxygenase-like lactoylglutathione lyase family enzyme
VVRTFGLTHLALAVRDAERTARFYTDVFGSAVVYRGQGFVQIQTPGSRDVIVFEERPDIAGTPGGVLHFGFRLVDPADIELAVLQVQQAGGTIESRGEFVPGEPYLFAKDPDGYEFEIWFELPTSYDPAD